jgi:hypothetical protein
MAGSRVLNFAILFVSFLCNFGAARGISHFEIVYCNYYSLLLLCGVRSLTGFSALPVAQIMGLRRRHRLLRTFWSALLSHRPYLNCMQLNISPVRPTAQRAQNCCQNRCFTIPQLSMVVRCPHMDSHWFMRDGVGHDRAALGGTRYSN